MPAIYSIMIILYTTQKHINYTASLKGLEDEATPAHADYSRA